MSDLLLMLHQLSRAALQNPATQEINLPAATRIGASLESGASSIVNLGTGCPSVREQMTTLERLSSAEHDSRIVSPKAKISDLQYAANLAKKVALAIQNH